MRKERFPQLVFLLALSSPLLVGGCSATDPPWTFARSPGVDRAVAEAGRKTATAGQRAESFADAVLAAQCRTSPDIALTAAALGRTVDEVCDSRRYQAQPLTLAGETPGIGLVPPLNAPIRWGSDLGTLTITLSAWTDAAWVASRRQPDGYIPYGRGVAAELRGPQRAMLEKLCKEGLGKALWNQAPGSYTCWAINRESEIAGGWSVYLVPSRTSGDHLGFWRWFNDYGPSVKARAVRRPVAGERCGLVQWRHAFYGNLWWGYNDHPDCVQDGGEGSPTPPTTPPAVCPINWTGSGVPDGWSLETCTRGPRSGAGCCHNLAGGGVFGGGRTCALSSECYQVTPPPPPITCPDQACSDAELVAGTCPADCGVTPGPPTPNTCSEALDGITAAVARARAACGEGGP